MDYERERRRQKRYREAMRNRIIAAVLLAGIIMGLASAGLLGALSGLFAV